MKFAHTRIGPYPKGKASQWHEGSFDLADIIRVSERVGGGDQHLDFRYFDVYLKDVTLEIAMRATDVTSLQALTTKKGGSMLQGLKKYLSDNQDTVFTIAFVAVVDQLFFDGAFREKLKSMIEKFLDSKAAA